MSASTSHDESMDVEMEVENPVITAGPYVASTVPGKPELINQLEFKDDFEEEEAQLSGNEDEDDEEEDDDDEVEGEEEENQQGSVPVSEWLDKSIDEDDETDGDFVPQNL
ncbi:hypothetical protein PNOK_0370800 [Pyrrhoderma noxium]|uniref:Uncharacterized protein n=1 Tax=Pyrrhoderma noxium TaxID=2282107 RepID=A0A286UN98_9AGAM|nr:hypothetical protein PNOK_0370800 [Pyrrhoderma noxium]